MGVIKVRQIRLAPADESYKRIDPFHQNGFMKRREEEEGKPWNDKCIIPWIRFLVCIIINQAVSPMLIAFAMRVINQNFKGFPREKCHSLERWGKSEGLCESLPFLIKSTPVFYSHHSFLILSFLSRFIFLLVLGSEYCSGYSDVFGKWNTGFYCPQSESKTAVSCCGTPTYKYCCTVKDPNEAEVEVAFAPYLIR